MAGKIEAETDEIDMDALENVAGGAGLSGAAKKPDASDWALPANEYPNMGMGHRVLAHHEPVTTGELGHVPHMGPGPAEPHMPIGTPEPGTPHGFRVEPLPGPGLLPMPHQSGGEPHGFRDLPLSGPHYGTGGEPYPPHGPIATGTGGEPSSPHGPIATGPHGLPWTESPSKLPELHLPHGPVPHGPGDEPKLRDPHLLHEPGDEPKFPDPHLLRALGGEPIRIDPHLPHGPGGEPKLPEPHLEHGHRHGPATGPGLPHTGITGIGEAVHVGGTAVSDIAGTVKGAAVEAGHVLGSTASAVADDLKKGVDDLKKIF